MTQLVKPSEFKREYTTGYSGFVPSRVERFGSSNGVIMKEIVRDGGRSPDYYHTINVDRITNIYSPETVIYYDKNKEIHGNRSRFGKNWPCGPSYQINEQRIPGYQGFIRGLKSENLFAERYSEITTKAFTKKHSVGHDVDNTQKFKTHNEVVFKPKNFRRFSK
jgi:hypothetical protein